VTIALAGGENAAVPTPKRSRKKAKPRDRHLEHQAIRLVVRADGSFVPADFEARKLCRDRKLYAGIEMLAYLYEPRDLKQWKQAHQVGTFLRDHVEKFSGMDAHAVLKTIQREARIHCDISKLEAAGVSFELVQPKTLAFGFMDETQWIAIYRQICEYIVKQGWLGEIHDEDAIAGLERLMLRERAA